MQKKYFLILLTVCLLSSCGVHRVTSETPKVYLDQGSWAAVEIETPTCKRPKCEAFALLVNSNVAQEAAVKELCKEKNHSSYICFGPEPAGRVITMERRRQ